MKRAFPDLIEFTKTDGEEVFMLGCRSRAVEETVWGRCRCVNDREARTWLQS